MSGQTSAVQDDHLAAVRAELLATVHRKTGWPNDDRPAGITRGAIHLELHHRGSHSLNDIERVLVGAVAEGDLIRWQDEYHRRFTPANERGFRKIRADQIAQAAQAADDSDDVLAHVPNRELFDEVCERLKGARG